MIRLALFDIDGTLIRTGGAGVRAFERTGAAEFHRPNGVSHIKFAGRTDVSLVREFFAAHDIPATDENFNRFFDRYAFLLEDQMRHAQGGPCAGVEAFLRGLRTLPEPPLLGLLTGNIRLGAEIKLRRFEMWALFETGAFGDDHEDRNELARIARARGSRVLGRELDGSEVLVVGDTGFDIACGRAIQARVLAVGTGGGKLEELRKHQPDWLVRDLREASPAEVCL